MEKKQCELCGEWFKNLGTHKRQAHARELADYTKTEPEPDDYIDEQLKSLISKIKELFRAYRAEIEVLTKEPMGTGKVEEVEIKARIAINNYNRGK